MAKGELIINESFCQGCGYCVQFCPKGCINQSGTKMSLRGFLLPSFSSSENCNACGICARMCPDYAIEVYKVVPD